MSVLRFVCVAMAALAGPAVAAAGPIEFSLVPTHFWTEPGAPAVGTTLSTLTPGPLAFDPAAGVPTQAPVIAYEPWRLAPPPPQHVHPDGTMHWNNEGYFTLDVRLTDAASGVFADLQFGGRAHMYNQYSTTGGWTGTTYWWFMDARVVTLGGNDYTVWGDNWYGTSAPALNVWVGPNPPAHLTPEPSGLLLGALALFPVGLRAARKRLTGAARNPG